MEYRRFGKTEKKLSAITLGGMRYLHGWDEPRDKIPNDTIEQITKCTQLALDNGINHIETAYGYKKSEHAYGIVLNDILKIPRNDYFLMTKGNPKTADETKHLVEKQLKALKTDYFDFYAWHGINNEELFQTSCKPGGPVEALLQLKEQGVIKHVGFSSHAPVEIILKSINTDLFEFVNLHYYYFFQRNYAAIVQAEVKDMGVFIISPNDKGGQLFNAPEKIKKITAPLTPIQWNARFCLRTPSIHTLSFGMTEPSHFEEMKGIFPTKYPFSGQDQTILFELDQQLLNDPYSMFEGYELSNDPSGINIPEVLRLRKLWKCYDMLDFGKYRYNMMQENDSWVPGALATKNKIEKIDMKNVPENIPLKEMLAETHEAFYKVKQYKLAK